jgi:Membrane bound beta barrel domain (DUF5777)
MKNILFCLLMASCFVAAAQDSTAPAPLTKKAKFAKNTFQSTVLINMQTTEMQPKGTMQFMVAHHFGVLWNKDASAGSNFAQVLGLNSGIAHTYLSLDYSLTNFANVGIGLTGNSTFEGWAKFRILRQQTGVHNYPVSVDWFSLANVNAQENPTDTVKANKLGWNKFTFIHQLIVARKFSKKFSLQLTGSYIHYNIVPYGINNSNDVFAVGMGGKYQLGDNKALTFEYSRQLNMHEHVIDKAGNINDYAPDLAAIGIEFNTGGHVFQFYVGNTTSAVNIEQLSRNTNFIKDGKFAMGFRLNRGFFIGGK